MVFNIFNIWGGKDLSGISPDRSGVQQKESPGWSGLRNNSDPTGLGDLSGLNRKTCQIFLLTGLVY
jgi:hypothetical protein